MRTVLFLDDYWNYIMEEKFYTKCQKLHENANSNMVYEVDDVFLL